MLCCCQQNVGERGEEPGPYTGITSVADESLPLFNEPIPILTAEAAEKVTTDKVLEEVAKQHKKASAKKLGRQASKIEADQLVAPAPELELGVFGHPGMKLQILLDTAWTDLGKDETAQISSSLRFGNQKFAIRSRENMYMIDFTDANAITQTNASSKKVRKIRLVPESAPASSPAVDTTTPVAKDETTPPAGGKGPETKKNQSCCVVS